MLNHIIFIGLVLLSVYLDESFFKCSKIYGKILIFFHHIISIIHWFLPFLFGYYKLHLFINISIMIGWVFFNNNCVLSMYHNKVCGLNQNYKWISLVGLFFKKLGLPYIFNLSFLLLLVIYDIYKITETDYPKIYKILSEK